MPENPLLDRINLESEFGGYEPPKMPADLPNVPFRELINPAPGYNAPDFSPLKALENSIFSNRTNNGKLTGGSIPRTLAEVTSNRFDQFVPGDYNNEDGYAQGQGWTAKMVNSVGKGLVLTGTTFLQSTLGMLNGLARWADTGRAASFYDNDFNRNLDEINKRMEDILPNYYTDVEKSAEWYSPSKLFTANFLWDGIVKNLGFAAGAALSGNVFSSALRAFPLTSRLFSIGKGAEALAATEEGLLAADKASQTFGKIKSLSDKFLSSYNVLNPAGRAVVAGLATTGEAGFEAYQNLNQFRNEKIEEYRNTHAGQDPIGEDLEKINRMADDVGNSSFMLNTALLSATNYIQFPKILGSTYKVEKGIINNLSKEIKDIAVDDAGNYIAKAATTKFGKILSTVNKVRPYVFSTSEGFEEGAQYAIQVGTQDYYDKKYNGKVTDFLSSLFEGVGRTIGTNEGMENILIGGLSGSLMMARGNYIEERERTRNTADAVQKFNKFKLSDFTKDTIDSINRGTVLQQEREDSLKNGDILESKDKETDYIINYLSPRIKYGRYDLVTSDIQELKTLASTEEGFAQLQAEQKVLSGDTREAYLKRLANLENTAKNIKSLYQSLQIRYGGFVDKNGDPIYSSDIMDKMVYAATKVADYDTRITNLSTELSDKGIRNTIDIVNDIAKKNFESYDAAINSLDKSSIDYEETRQSLQDVAEITLRRSKLLTEYNDIKNNPNKYKEAPAQAPPIAKTPEGKGKKTVALKTVDGDEELEIGTEYYAGAKRIAVKEKEAISRYSKFRLIGEDERNADNVIIQTPDGKYHTIKKIAFEQYKIGKVADTDKRANAKFFIETTDHIFTYNIGKKENNPKGYLEYNPKDDSLHFVSLDGKFKRRVTRDQFSPKEGYTVAQIYSNQKFTPKAEEAVKEVVTAEDRMATRNKILVDLYNQSKEELSSVKENLSAKKKELEKIKQDIDQAALTKKGSPRKNIDAVRKAVSALTKSKEEVEKQIVDLETRQAELEQLIPYLQDVLDFSSELPESGAEMLKQMREDLANVKELADHTSDAIKEGKAIVETINSAIQTATSILNDFIKRLKEENPNVPLYMDVYISQLEKYLGEEGAKQVIADKAGFTNLVIDLQDQISSFTEELNIPQMQSKVDKLTSQISELQEGLDKLAAEQKARETVLNAFEQYAERERQRKEAEERLKKDKELIKQFFGTMSTDVQVVEGEKVYEPASKKDDLEVVGSTIAASYEDAKRPYNQRANRFGYRFHSLDNKDNIKGVVVTAKTEDQLIPGLTELLVTVPGGEKKADPSTVIALVMTDENGVPVDEFGQPIADPKEYLEKAVFQVFPLEKLTATYDGKTETMFRSTTPDVIKNSLSEQYAAWRKTMLEQSTISAPVRVTASFGIPQYVRTVDDKGKEKIDYNSPVAVESAGLITSSALKDGRVVKIATTNESISNGSVTFTTPLGRVFLEVPGGLVKLYNRKLNKKEVNVVYDAILQLSKNAFKNGNIKDADSKKLVDWLKSVVYWGIAKQEGQRKPAGYNNIWFEDVTDEKGETFPKLFISGKGEGFTFTPSELEANKEVILSLLSNIYGNANATLLNDRAYNQPYFQITAINPDGTIEAKEWPNYQTFLVSSEGRSADEIPFTTRIRPLVDENDVNREGIYFTMVDAVDNYVLPEEAPKPPVKPEVKEGAPAAPAKTQSETFDLTGEKENTIQLGTYGMITFSLDGKKFIESGNKKGLSITFDKEVVLAIMADKKVDEKKAQQIIAASIINKLKGQLAALTIPEAPPMEVKPVAPVVTPAPTAPVSDIDAKKAKRIVEAKFAQQETQFYIEVKGENKDFLLTWDRNSNKPSLWGEKQPDGTYKATLEYPTEEEVKKLVDKYVPKSLLDLINKWTEASKLPAEKVLDAQDKIAREIEKELAALEGAKPAEEKPTAPEAKGSAFRNRKRGNRPDDKAYRMELAKQAGQFFGEDWDKVEAWLKENFPNLPVYRVKNVIRAANGKQAWGFFQNGALYIYENAEVGTVYHEVFEAVWNMFTTPEEREAVMKEFRSRSGSYEDRFTGETIEYKNATDDQLKEELAEEFRDYRLYNKIPQKPKDGRPFIVKLFSDLVNFIKTFFTGREAALNTEKLFKRIGEGYYSKFVPNERALSYAQRGIIDIDDVTPREGAQFRFKYIPSAQVHEIMEQMTYSVLTRLSKTNQNLFQVSTPINKRELYNELKQELLDIIGYQGDMIEKNLVEGTITQEQADKQYNDIETLYNAIHDDNEEWEALIKKHKEYLMVHSVKFDENDDLQRTDENKIKESDFVDSRKVDGIRHADSAIKMLLATLPIAQRTPEGPRVKRSTIGGVMLVPRDKVIATLYNRLHSSVNLDDMLSRLKQLAIEDVNYEALYNRLTKGSINEASVDYTRLNNPHDWQLLSLFWTTFSKMNADVKTVFILPTGDVVFGDSALSSASRQKKDDMFNSIISTLRSGTSYLKYDKPNKKYNVTSDISKVKLLSDKISTYINFLDKIGVEFTEKEYNKLSDDKKKVFREAVEGILLSVSGLKDISSLNKQTLGMEGNLLKLGALRAIIENPEFETTYFNVNGERVQTFIGSNVISRLHNVISKLKNINELANTHYKYLLTDKFTTGSVILNRIFNEEGKRRKNTEDILAPGYVDGIVNEQSGKNKEASKVTDKERLIQEINANLNGYYMNLVPGDASIESMIKLHSEDDPFVSSKTLSFGWTKVNEIFKNYFISEVELARDERPVVEGRNSEDLRFFYAILGEELHSEIMSKKNEKYSAEKLYEEYSKEIDKAVVDFIKDRAKETREDLEKFGIIYYTEEGMKVDNLAFAKEEDVITEDFIKNELEALTTNYIIANIELHKLIYGDPYSYSDELKRIKNFGSPAKALMVGSDKVNAALNKAYNAGYSQGELGWTDMEKDYFVSSVVEDPLSTIDLKDYGIWPETDGGGIITDRANRVYGIRAGDWTDANEKQYRYDIAWEKEYRINEAKESGKELTKEEKKRYRLSDSEKQLLKEGNPQVMSTYTPRKPIVRGSKADGNDYNDVVLDKFALVPYSFRILKQINPTANAIKLYEKMLAEGVDYVVFDSGRKVSKKNPTPLYTPEAEFNEAPFNELNNIPFQIMAVQTEVPSKDVAEVTQGSQITKLVTMDFMDAGVPVDFMEDVDDINTRLAAWIDLKTDEEKTKKSRLYKEILDNQKLLEARIDEGINVLLTKLGLEKTQKGYKLTADGVNKLIDTLASEIMKREVNDNISLSLEGFKKGDVILEATPAYQQIRNILFSIADKNVISPKISGAMKVQISSALLESERIKVSEIVDKKGNKKYVYSANEDVLGFYKDEDGKRVCEIMVGRWFDNETTRKMSDEQLLNYLNTTEEGKKILEGIGFRIPTQKQNSIDAFRIKKFLPKEFGDSVVIPSALVKKVGSDFDIDKLSIYLKNVFTDPKGNIKYVPYFGIGEQAKNKFREMFDKGELLSPEDAKELYRIIEEERDELFSERFDEDGKLLKVPENKLFIDIFGDVFSEEQITKDFIEQFTKKGVRDAIVNKMYKQSLENEYIESLQRLVTHPKNFDKLITPNSAENMKKIAADIVEKTKQQEFDYKSVGNILNRRFMSSLRQAFVTGKYAIGIAAVAQTNHAQNQRSPITIDRDRLDTNIISNTDKKYLGNGVINLPHNKIRVGGKLMATLSMVKNQAGEIISDIIGQFIDGYVDISKGPWIMQLGAKPNVASTWLFLLKVGVPVKTTSYFMNQPIIRDFLRNIENAGYSWIFNDRMIEDIQDIYSPSAQIEKPETLPNEEELYKMLGKSKKDMNNDELNNQLFILDEFLKYAKMAEHLFLVTQGSNFDTATINDPFLVFKKMMQLKRARNTIISSVDDILKNSFVGKLKDAYLDIRNMFSEVLVSDKPNVRAVMEKVLEPYVFESDRDFIKISQKAVNDLFDWAVQTNETINSGIADILLGKEDQPSAAKEIIAFRNKVLADKEHSLYNNLIINSIRSKYGQRDGTPNNLYLLSKDGKAYNQNQVIYAFEELKKALGQDEKALYGKLVRLAVIQSGLSNSAISFTSLLPYEDFKEVYNETLFKLEEMNNLQDFYKLNVFQRANATNDDVVPNIRARFIKAKKPKDDGSPRWIYNLNMKTVSKKLKNATANGQIPQMLNISVYSREGNHDVITYIWEETLSRDKEENKRLKAEKRKKGDYSYLKKGLFQKVYYENEKGERVPYIDVREEYGKIYENYVYKMINAWGDSFRANEFYDHVRPSVIDNGFIKVEAKYTETVLPGTTAVVKERVSGEVDDDAVISILMPTQAAPAAPTEAPVTAEEASLKSQIAALEEKKKTTGITASEAGQLAKLQTELGKIIKSRC